MEMQLPALMEVDVKATILAIANDQEVSIERGWQSARELIIQVPVTGGPGIAEVGAVNWAKELIRVATVEDGDGRLEFGVDPRAFEDRFLPEMALRLSDLMVQVRSLNQFFNGGEAYLWISIQASLSDA